MRSTVRARGALGLATMCVLTTSVGRGCADDSTVIATAVAARGEWTMSNGHGLSFVDEFAGPAHADEVARQAAAILAVRP